ncbi:hypothetical protein [uncultured Algimonas sp.]|uniref:hypothetical protein n=1 Tax=uncultured Algimonas sp. TaxID=1547920 RepID=UPI0026337921|nr:hypothetical protein [uncultured Algimonas sp.]
MDKSDEDIDAAFDEALDARLTSLDAQMAHQLTETRVNYISLFDVICESDVTLCSHFDTQGWPILVDNSHFSRQASIEVVAKAKSTGRLRLD